MTVDSGTSVQSLEHSSLVLVILLVAVALNLLYPGEVFFQSRYLLVLCSLLACAVVLYRDHKKGISTTVLHHLALAFLPLTGMAVSSIWTTNQDRTQEVLLLFFSYACLLFSLWRCKLRSGALLASLFTLVATTIAVEGLALYQHFAGLEALKAELARQSTMDPDFKTALLALVQSGRIFANFSLPNTLAGLVTMILPIQGALICASFLPTRLKEVPPGWVIVLMSLWTRIALIAGIVLSIWVLALTQSFGGWVGLCCSLLTVVLVRLDTTGLRTRWVLGLAFMLLAGSWLAWISQKRGFHLWDLNAAENPISLRIISCRTALTMFQDFPLVGVGLGNYGGLNPRYQTSPRFVTQFAHNTPLQVISEGGLVLLAGLLLAVGVASRITRRHIRIKGGRSDPLFLGMLGALAAWLVHNLLDIDLYFPSLGALGFFLAGLFSHYLSGEVEREESPHSVMGKAPVVVIEVALGLALLTGIRFQLSRSCLDLAGISASAGNLSDACKYARWAVKFRPQDASGVVFLGKLETAQLKKDGQPASALLQRLSEALKEAVHLDPYNAEFHFELSRLYKGLGDEKLSANSRATAALLFPSTCKARL